LLKLAESMGSYDKYMQLILQGKNIEMDIVRHQGRWR
jgi:hypothetical protein